MGPLYETPRLHCASVREPSGVLWRIIARIMARETADLNQRAVELLRLQPADHVVEIGFGHGRTVQRIATAVPDGRVAGVDLSASMNRAAIRRNRAAIADDRVDLLTSDAAALPFDDGHSTRRSLFIRSTFGVTQPPVCVSSAASFAQAGPSSSASPARTARTPRASLPRSIGSTRTMRSAGRWSTPPSPSTRSRRSAAPRSHSPARAPLGDDAKTA